MSPLCQARRTVEEKKTASPTASVVQSHLCKPCMLDVVSPPMTITLLYAWTWPTLSR
jgi:hypothetical protein